MTYSLTADAVQIGLATDEAKAILSLLTSDFLRDKVIGILPEDISPVVKPILEQMPDVLKETTKLEKGGKMWDSLNAILSSTEITSSTALVRLLISFVLGASIGLERQYRRREAGLRTFTLICLGSTAAMLISIWIPQSYPNFLNGDPGRIAAQVLSGIGFLGAGAIIQSKGSVYGLTTAACIWVVAVIGLSRL